MSPRLRNTSQPRKLYRVELGGARFVVLSVPCALDNGTELSLLTSAERAVAKLALQGLSDADIARRRGVAKRTVANQLAAIFRKLGVGSRFELAARSLASSSRTAATRSRSRDISLLPESLFRLPRQRRSY